MERIGRIKLLILFILSIHVNSLFPMSTAEARLALLREGAVGFRVVRVLHARGLRLRPPLGRRCRPPLPPRVSAPPPSRGPQTKGRARAVRRERASRLPIRKRRRRG